MQITLDERELYDLECIYLGLYKPLDGFMNSIDYSACMSNCSLKSGHLWSLPVTLAHNSIIAYNDKVTLKHPEGFILGYIEHASMIYPDIELECESTLGTTDDNHPYVKYLKQRNKERPYYVGGKVIFEQNIPWHFDFNMYRLTREQIKEWCDEQHNVVGFQTRNPMHKAHFYLTLKSLTSIDQSDSENTNDKTSLLLTPAVGPTQQGDVNYSIRMKTYIEMLNEYKKQNINAKLAILPLSMRMAGPREALHHAIIRMNIGCTHFIVGRDHAGPSTKTKNGESFYKPDAAHKFLETFKEKLNIKIITSPMIMYSKTRDTYITADEQQENDEVIHLSGTEQRRLLADGKPLPSWFTFEKINDILMKHNTKKGLVIYLYGLSGSGKSTLSKYLKTKLEERVHKPITLLDGDIVRLELSKGLGFSKEDRSLNVRRIGFVASQIALHGGICICANIAPYKEDRDFNRERISGHGTYIEVLVDTPLEVCEQRDVKGLYKLAREGKLANFTGISDPFEKSEKNDFVFDGSTLDNLSSNVNVLLEYLETNNLI